MIEHFANPVLRSLRQEEYGFKGQPWKHSKTLYQNIYILDVVAFICNLNTWKMDTIKVRSGVQDHPLLYVKDISNKHI